MVGYPYRIVVAGVVGIAARQAFAAFDIEQVGSDSVLRAELDQASLFEVLDRALALGLELIEIAREDPDVLDDLLDGLLDVEAAG